MSIKNLIFFFSFIFLVPVCYSQQFSILWHSDPRLRDNFQDAIQLPGGNYLLLKFAHLQYFTLFSEPPDPSLVLVNAEMVPVKETKLEFDEKHRVYEGLKKYGNNIFFIYSAYDRENKNRTVYALKINPQLASTAGKITMGIFDSSPNDDYSRESPFDLKISPDSSKVLLFAEGPERKKENKECYIGVYDTDLKKIWAKEQELPINDRMVSFYDENLGNDGKVFIALKQYDKEVTRETVKENGDKIPSYSYKIFVYVKEGLSRQVSFDMSNQFIQGTKLLNGKNDQVIVAGLYKKKHNGNITGAFYCTFDNLATEVKNIRMVEFPSDILTPVDKESQGRYNGPDPGLSPNFTIKHILFRSDGSIDMLSEYASTTWRPKALYTTRFSGPNTDKTYFWSGDIINVNLDENGKAIITRIPKRQEGEGHNMGLGYYPAVYKDKLILFYNDNISNMDRDISKVPDTYWGSRKSVFAAAIVDRKGNVTRQAIYDYRQEKQWALPEDMSKISETKYLITSGTLGLDSPTRYGILDIK
jgi:hypothetical protein